MVGLDVTCGVGGGSSAQWGGPISSNPTGRDPNSHRVAPNPMRGSSAQCGALNAPLRPQPNGGAPNPSGGSNPIGEQTTPTHGVTHNPTRGSLTQKDDLQPPMEVHNPTTWPPTQQEWHTTHWKGQTHRSPPTPPHGTPRMAPHGPLTPRTAPHRPHPRWPLIDPNPPGQPPIMPLSATPLRRMAMMALCTSSSGASALTFTSSKSTGTQACLEGWGGGW